eukprot:14622944-Alexandrium_andersonii.AAC.1
MCALACVLFPMTTADTVPSITSVRDVKALLSQSNALAGGRALQNADTYLPPPIPPDAFTGENAMQ